MTFFRHHKDINTPLAGWAVLQAHHAHHSTTNQWQTYTGPIPDLLTCTEMVVRARSTLLLHYIFFSCPRRARRGGIALSRIWESGRNCHYFSITALLPAPRGSPKSGVLFTCMLSNISLKFMYTWLIFFPLSVIIITWRTITRWVEFTKADPLLWRPVLR